MTERPTSHDVARVAGVSQSTVSYALSGRGRISDATRDKVLEAAATLGYRPNLAARTMRTRRTGRLAIVLPQPPLPTQVVAAAAKVAVDAGYTLEIHASASGSPKHEVLTSGMFEGVLTFTSLGEGNMDDDADARAKLADGPAIVSLSEDFDEHMRVTGSLLGAAPIGEIVSTLVSWGHERFLHLAGRQDFTSGRARREAYLEAVASAGVTDLGVFACEWSGQLALEAVRSLPADTPPVAIIAANDVLATAAVRGALERGWRVPQDVTVTGWDNQPTTAYQWPPLTTVEVDMGALGAWAMQTLIARLRDQPAPHELVGVQRIIWRETSGVVVPR